MFLKLNFISHEIFMCTTNIIIVISLNIFNLIICGVYQQNHYQLLLKKTSGIFTTHNTDEANSFW